MKTYARYENIIGYFENAHYDRNWYEVTREYTSQYPSGKKRIVVLIDGRQLRADLCTIVQVF